MCATPADHHLHPCVISGGLSSEALWEAVQELHAGGETDLKEHLDFLLASTE